MKEWKKLGLYFTMFILNCSLYGASVEGQWATIDDVSGKKRALVNIEVLDGKLSGTIIEVYPQPGDTGLCQHCPGAFKGKSVKGLAFLWGLKDKGQGVWDDGKILDPKTGKIYRAKITLDGNKLYVRGYLGISVLGRTQTWVR